MPLLSRYLCGCKVVPVLRAYELFYLAGRRGRAVAITGLVHWNGTRVMDAVVLNSFPEKHFSKISDPTNNLPGIIPDRGRLALFAVLLPSPVLFKKKYSNIHFLVSPVIHTIYTEAKLLTHLQQLLAILRIDIPVSRVIYVE